jgi:eukaryotic-like serine/threonine-protein kinase
MGRVDFKDEYRNGNTSTDETEFNEFSSQFSPDGNWMAYVSDESGTLDVYVRAFPSSDNRWRISNNGGSQPRWRHDGKELFYVAHDGTLMAVEIARGATFAASVPRPLFKTRITDTGISGMSYSVAIDGQRFLIHTITDDRPTWTTTVLLNWLALTKR